MRFVRLLMFACGCCIASAAISTAQSRATGSEEARELVRSVETQYQGKTSHAIATLRVVTDRWNREMTLEMWSIGRDKFLARILKPGKDEGVSSLKLGNEMWNYLPNIDRLVKIPSSMMGESWMGSHLTNDDLLKENQIDELYDLTLKKVGNSAEVTGVPKPDAAVVWGRILYTIDIERLIPITIRYYDEADTLVRTITFDDVKKVSGRWIPLRMLVRPEDKPAERTELVYTTLTFDVKLADDFFSLRSLRRR
jgi:outer membrane lipoprotein-sorting protein